VLSFLLVPILAFQPGLITLAGAEKNPQGKEAGRVGKLKERVLGIPIGTTVQVQLTSGEKAQGKMGEVRNDGFMLVEEGNPQAQRQILFSELRSIKVQQKGPSLIKPLVKAAILSGVLAGAILVSALLLRT
jgi:hypothetical protein